MWAWCLLFWLFLVTGALSQYTFQDAAFGLSNLRVLSDQNLLMKGVENIVSFAIQNEEHMASVIQQAINDDGLAFTPQCKLDLAEYQKQLENFFKHGTGTFWARKMFDATGKFPDGILAGNFNALGSYTSCLNVDGQYLHGAERVEVKGRYALAKIGVLGPFKGSFGICLPDSCKQKEDFKQFLHTVIPKNKTTNEPLTDYDVGPSQTKDDEFKWLGVDIAFLIFVSILGIFLLIATAYDYVSQIKGRNPKAITGWEKTLMSFSVHSNTAKLLRIGNPSKDHLTCLDGIRTFSITWVMVGHWMMNFEGPTKINNLFKFFNLTVENHLFQVIDNAMVSVDTFFLLSACLVTYLTMKELDKNMGRINIPLFYIHRWLRLTGVYAFCIFFQASLVSAFTYGPMAGDGDIMIEGCRKYSWRNIFYLQIWIEDEGILACLGQTWYLDNDMFFFAISLLMIYPIWKMPKLGLSLMGGYIASSIALLCTLTHKNHWKAVGYLDAADQQDYSYHNYIKPWCRIQPYLVGILLGYALHKTKNKEIKIPKLMNLALWAAAFAIGIAIVYGLNVPKRYALPPDNVQTTEAINIAYGGLSRFSWAVAVSWVIFACCRGYGGWVNDLLSWEAFQPLSKISYLMYLTHISIYQVITQSFTYAFTYSHTIAVLYFFSAFVITVLVSGVLSVCVELPWLNLEKLGVEKLLSFMGGGRKPETEELQVPNQATDNKNVQTEAGKINL